MEPEEQSLPEGVRDILTAVPREMRQQIITDYASHYAPFLNMLAGWKAAIQTHYAYGEASAIAQLQEQFFPLGDWRFPAQGLTVPIKRAEQFQRIRSAMQFSDPISRVYTPCGEGWVQPTQLRQCSLRQQEGRWLVLIDIDFGGSLPESILSPGQLAFIAAREETVVALAKGQWWFQSARRGMQRVICSRFEGYMAFEQEMRSARLRQHQLELWLPPFYPYGRKMLTWSLTEDIAEVRATGIPEELTRLPSMESGLRLVGVVDNPSMVASNDLRRLSSQRDTRPWILLNAVPMIQAAVEEQPFPAPFPRVGEGYGERLRGAPAIFAAVAYHDEVAVPVSMTRIPSADPLATEPDVLVQFAQTEARNARIKLYHSASGQTQTDGSDLPSGLSHDPLSFSMPFPMLGGATLGGAENRAEWARSAWYHSVLRPPLLTEGDLIEQIRQKQVTMGQLVTFQRARRAIVQDMEQRDAHWQSYLWPSIIAQETSFGIETGGLPANAIPLLQSLQIDFASGPDSRALPEFLTGDSANYLASTLSQYFVLSCFRIEGRVVE